LDAVRSCFERDGHGGGRRARPAGPGQCQLNVTAAVDAEVERPAAVQHVSNGQGVVARGTFADVVDRDVVRCAIADVAHLLAARAGRATGDHGRAGKGVGGGFGLDMRGAGAGDAVHDGAVCGDGGADGAGGGGGGAGPQVGEAVAGGAGFADGRGAGGDGGGVAVFVEQGDGDVAVGQGFGQHVQAAGG